MAVNEQLKRFSKQQLSVLVFSVLNTVLAIACGIWALVIFLKKKEKGDKVGVLIIDNYHSVNFIDTSVSLSGANPKDSPGDLVGNSPARPGVRLLRRPQREPLCEHSLRPPGGLPLWRRPDSRL